MSPRRAGPQTGRGGRIAITILLVVSVAIGMFLIGRERPDPGPLDPRSNNGDGTRALVLLLEEQGASVEIVRRAPAHDGTTRLLVLDDSLDDDVRAGVLDFVDRGGVVVVADPTSELHGGAGTEEGGAQRVTGTDPDLGGRSAVAESNIRNRECSIGALEDLRGVFVRDGVMFPVETGQQHCIGDGGHSFAIRRDVGAGSIVGLGDNLLFSNALLRYADNGPLAVALLAPQRGAAVAILLGDSVAKAADDLGSGEESLGDLVRPGVWMGLAQLLLAFMVLALARGIRPGRPVDEPLPSPLEGSEATRARATLMKRAAHHGRAGWLLRSDLHRELCERYHLPRTASNDDVDRAAAGRDGTAAGEVAAILATESPDARSLLDLSNRVARLRADQARGAEIPVPVEGATR